MKIILSFKKIEKRLCSNKTNGNFLQMYNINSISESSKSSLNISLNNSKLTN